MLDFQYPWVLLLLPVVLLPLLGTRKETLRFPSVTWLPADRTGPAVDWLTRVLAMLAMSCIVFGLASPGRSGAQIPRIGHGAEVLILMDRSTSMDDYFRPKGGTAAQAEGAKEGNKSRVARDLLTRFVNKRPEDRFALTTFSSAVMTVAPFTTHNDAVLAGLAATGVGRGLPHTDMASALLEAIDAFQQRAYSGSRIILLVSDGGAKLDEETQRQVREGLQRNRIGLYFIYIRSSALSPNLNVPVPPPADDEDDEMTLHRFFLSLPTPYHLFQADDPNAMATALKDIDREQNLPLSYLERVPRQDNSAVLFLGGLLSVGLLFACGALNLRPWA